MVARSDSRWHRTALQYRYAFGQRGFGEQAIPFGLFEGFLNPGLRNGLELELHGKVRLSNCESRRQARVGVRERHPHFHPGGDWR